MSRERLAKRDARVRRLKARSSPLELTVDRDARNSRPARVLRLRRYLNPNIPILNGQMIAL
jgi:hypothetical protein